MIWKRTHEEFHLLQRFNGWLPPEVQWVVAPGVIRARKVEQAHDKPELTSLGTTEDVMSACSSLVVCSRPPLKVVGIGRGMDQ